MGIKTTFENSKKVAQVFSITGKYLRLSKKQNSDVVLLKSLWAKEILQHLNLNVQIIGKPSPDHLPSLLVGNHISYLDIPILMAACPDVSFVSKKEVQTWPIIGTAAQKAETIFVTRESVSSRAAAVNEIAKCLVENKQRVALFPSGTTSIQPTTRWKKGAFEIAKRNEVQIQPFRIRYKPLRAAAYIDQDHFLIHLYQLFQLGKIDVTIEFHEPVNIEDSLSECERWKIWCEDFI
jgi:1-acyl-sn-glycerol-3-phosphate acyltransferase